MSHPAFTASAAKALDHLRQELASIRTGRANPSVIEALPVECYGGISPLQEIAAISAPESRLLVVQPWDPSIIKDIEKALRQSTLGINPVVDGKVIRLPIPSMTEERRTELLKVVHTKAEETRIRLRSAREEAMKQLKQDEKTGAQSEDAVSVGMKNLQQAVDQANADVTAHVERKTQEVTAI